MKSKKKSLGLFSCAFMSAFLLLTNTANATTVSGKGGVSRLDCFAGGLRWEVRPDTLWPYEFVGQITYTRSKLSKYPFPVSGVGALHSWTSGSAPATATGKGSTATLTGTAYAINGSKFVTLPNCKVAY